MSGPKYDALYVKIDAKKYVSSGEVSIISRPMLYEEIVSTAGTAPKGGYEIVRPEVLYEFLRSEGGKWGEIVPIILSGRDISNRTFYTLREIATKAGASITTVKKVVDSLYKAGFVRKFRGGLMVNPTLIHKGNHNREKYLLDEFKSFDTPDMAAKSDFEEIID